MQSLKVKPEITVLSIKDAIIAEIGNVGFNSWFSSAKFDLVNGCFRIVVQNQFSADYIKSSYGIALEKVLSSFSLSFDVCIASQNKNCVSANDNVSSVYVPVHKPEISRKTSNKFDSFVASDENMFVIAACKKIAMGNASFSQLFMYGPSGCGKTLLTSCIASESDGRVVSMSGGQFVADFARSLKEKTIFAFKDFCRNCDTFILDDVCALAGKRASMDEFLQLVLDLHSAGKKVVLTSTVAPNALVGFDRRMQSLFASGLVVDIVAPNAYARRIMLTRAGLDANVVEELSKNVAADGHVIDGIISKIKTYTELMGEKVNIDIASRLLGDVFKKNKTPLSKVKSMCEKMNISYEEICGNCRSRRLVKARQLMMAALKYSTGLSLSEIGNVCGGKDHATVVYALNQIENQKKSDLILGAELEEMIALCK